MMRPNMRTFVKSFIIIIIYLPQQCKDMKYLIEQKFHVILITLRIFQESQKQFYPLNNYLNIQKMKDVNLDDLIKEDKDKQKQKNKGRTNNRNDRGRGRRLIKRGPRNDRPNSRPQGRGPNSKKRIIRNKDDRNPKKFKKFNKDREDREDRNPNRKGSQGQVEKKQRSPKQKRPEEPKQEKGRTLKVLGLHPDIKNEDLYKLFAAEGALQKCMIEQDNFGRNLPSAIVKYHSAETAKQAIANINSKKILNSVLTVEPYRNTRN